MIDNVTKMIGKIWYIIRDYPVNVYHIVAVRDETASQLRNAGYDVSVSGNCTIIVNGEKYRIYKVTGWNRFDVRHVGNDQHPIETSTHI